MTDLSSLIARLEKAGAPDRELDAEIAIVLGVIPGRDWWSMDYIKSGILGRYTSSIDAAVSLAERVLPGLSKIQPETYVGGEFHHCEIETEEGDFEAHNCPNVAIAICLATLRALDQGGSSNG